MNTSSRLRLLVVDDEPDLRTLYELTLVREGYEVDSAESVEQAWAMHAAQRYQLVITDMRLPDGNGLALAAQLVAALPARPAFIAYTGQPSLEGPCRAAAIDHFLLKPADPMQLADVVARCARV